MESHTLQTLAGFTSSFIFASSHIPMLQKALKTKDLKSYSPANLVLCNIGNLIHWLYIISLPLGPIWYLHGFFTITTALMLVYYLRFEQGQTPRAILPKTGGTA